MSGIRTHYYSSGVQEFEVETRDDVYKLPTCSRSGLDEFSSYGPAALGSSVLIISEAVVLKLRSDGQWKEMGENG